MAQVVFSQKQMRIFEILNLVLIFAGLGFGLLYQIMGWRLDGTHLILVCIIFVNFLNLGRLQSARIDELEKRLSAPQA